MRGRRVHVQCRGQRAVAHGHDHLDDAADTGGGLRVPDVGLQRAEPQRLPAVLAVRGDQGLRLDGVTQLRARAVRLHRVHQVGGEAGLGQRGPDDPLLRGTVRRGQAARRAVLVDRGAADDGEDPVTGPPGVRQPFDDQHAGALAPGRAVGGGREGLDAPVGRQSAQLSEPLEGDRCGHHGHTARQRHGALATPYRLHRQVQGDQGRRAGGVDGRRGPLQAQRVGDPARDDAAPAATAQEAGAVLVRLAQAGGVVVVHQPRVHADAGAAQRRRVDAGAFQGLPRHLQQQSLLRVHGEGLARADPEERRVEVGGTVQETAPPAGGHTGQLTVGVVELPGGPAPFGRRRADGVPTLRDQPPQGLGGVDAVGEPARHADDRDGLAVGLLQLGHPAPGLAQFGRGPAQVLAELLHC